LNRRIFDSIELIPTPLSEDSLIIEERTVRRRSSPPVTEHLVVDRPTNQMPDLIEEKRTTDGDITTIVTRHIKSSNRRPQENTEDHSTDSITHLPKVY